MRKAGKMGKTKRQAGQLGGRATVARHGREHMQAIGKRGAAELWRRYELRPAGLSDFALIRKSDGALVAYLSGAPVGARRDRI